MSCCNEADKTAVLWGEEGGARRRLPAHLVLSVLLRLSRQGDPLVAIHGCERPLQAGWGQDC